MLEDHEGNLAGRRRSATRAVSRFAPAAAWTLAALFGVVSLVVQGQPGWAAAAVGLAGVLILLSLRRRASSAPGALYTSAADYLPSPRRQLPGQLSLTAQEVVWRPSRYSRRHGQPEVVIPLRDGVLLTLDKGPALLDVVLSVTADRAAWRFGTHRSRRLDAVLDRLGGDR